MKTNSLKIKKGFTLIELLIVIAVISILASAVLLGLGPVQARGRDARRLSDLRQIQNALELYYSKCNYYPGGDASGGCLGWSDISNDWLTLTNALQLSGIGINNVPSDPTLDAAFPYVYGSVDGTGYVLKASLETLNSSLRQDIDGTVQNIDCTADNATEEAALTRTDRSYCVSL